MNLLNFPQEGQYFTAAGRPFGVIERELTRTFTNAGDTSVGMLINMIALDSVVNPRISCSTGEQNGWYMQLNLTLSANDILEINTVKGQKYITINGMPTYKGEPIINALEWYGTEWLQLETGKNTFSVTTNNGSTNGNLYFNLIYKGRYE